MKLSPDINADNSITHRALPQSNFDHLILQSDSQIITKNIEKEENQVCLNHSCQLMWLLPGVQYGGGEVRLIYKQ